MNTDVKCQKCPYKNGIVKTFQLFLLDNFKISDIILINRRILK